MLLSIVIPCYNEADVLPQTVGKLLGIIDDMVADGLISTESYLLLCNDGSNDATDKVIRELNASDSRVRGIMLAHNVGQQRCLLAGLMTVKDSCDAAITIDADLQDDATVIPEMVRLYKQGYDVVYGVRNSRNADSRFKRTTAHAFYRLQRSMDIEIKLDHADFRLMSNRAIRILSQYPERNIYLRGLIPSIGLKSTTVEYARQERNVGSSKYSIRKMLSLSLDGITSFSAKPMRMIWMAGLLMMLLDVIVAVYVLAAWLQDETVSGWTSIMLSIWFLGGLMLMSIGVIGEYLGKIFIEVKQRPHYAIVDTVGFETSQCE